MIKYVSLKETYDTYVLYGFFIKHLLKHYKKTVLSMQGNFQISDKIKTNVGRQDLIVFNAKSKRWHLLL